MWKVYLVEFIVVVIVSIFWVRSIDKMMTEHPDYKGEDFLNHDYEDDKKEDWDSVFEQIEGPLHEELSVRVKNWLRNTYLPPIKK